MGRTDKRSADPRFRLTPLCAGACGLSLYRRSGWGPVSYEGKLQQLAVTMNNDLSAWPRTGPYLLSSSTSTAHEKKNWSIVRKVIGYDRYEGAEALAQLNRVYDVLRLWTNHW